MPQIPSPYDELPLLKDVPVGTELTVVKAINGKTEKNGYQSVTLDTIEKGKLFSIDAGVLQAFIKIGAGPDADLSKFSEDEKEQALNHGCSSVTKADPLKVRTAEFKNKFGKMSYTIKNR